MKVLTKQRQMDLDQFLKVASDHNRDLDDVIVAMSEAQQKASAENRAPTNEDIINEIKNLDVSSEKRASVLKAF
ncbi:MAG: hypothetical protein AAGI92_04770 [Pseudomonadota bacterium]